jgi:hypothetical protein
MSDGPEQDIERFWTVLSDQTLPVAAFVTIALVVASLVSLWMAMSLTRMLVREANLECVKLSDQRGRILLDAKFGQSPELEVLRLQADVLKKILDRDDAKEILGIAPSSSECLGSILGWTGVNRRVQAIEMPDLKRDGN